MDPAMHEPPALPASPVVVSTATIENVACKHEKNKNILYVKLLKIKISLVNKIILIYNKS